MKMSTLVLVAAAGAAAFYFRADIKRQLAALGIGAAPPSGATALPEQRAAPQMTNFPGAVEQITAGPSRTIAAIFDGLDAPELVRDYGRG